MKPSRQMLEWSNHKQTNVPPPTYNTSNPTSKSANS